MKSNKRHDHSDFKDTMRILAQYHYFISYVAVIAVLVIIVAIWTG